MTNRAWQAMILGLIEGIDANLCVSAPKHARIRLRQFRQEVMTVRTAVDQKRYERCLESFLQSKPYTRAAAKRYLSPLLNESVKRASEVSYIANAVLRGEPLPPNSYLSPKVKWHT